MKKLIFTLSLLASLAFTSNQVQALALTVTPTPEKIHPGDPLVVTVGVTGLHSQISANSQVDSLLAAYSFDLRYSPGDLWFPLGGSQAYNHLGDPTTDVLFSIDYLTDPGIIHFAAASLLMDQTALALAQSDASGNLLDSFPLVDFLFYGQPTGPHFSYLWAENPILGDFLGDPVPLLDLAGAPILDTSGNVMAAPVGNGFAVVRIPEPATPALLLFGFSLLLAYARQSHLR